MTETGSVPSEAEQELEGDRANRNIRWQGAYLKALIEHDGSVAEASRTVDLGCGRLGYWRTNPEFLAAEAALRTWISTRPVIPSARRASQYQLKRFLELLENPNINIGLAARSAGLSRSQVMYWTENDAKFKARLDWLRPVGKGGCRGLPEEPIRRDRAPLAAALLSHKTVGEAAREVGITTLLARQIINEDKELLELVKMLTAQGRLRRTGYEPKPIDEAWLKKNWFRPELSTKELAQAVGITDAQLRNRARKLGLPSNRKAALKEIQ
ncbi:hypothetical protein ACFYUY_01625 [Kitasatospora sp. NPDC004745]|uniref:hypothetical protein n=1 Tax=Kitasatospora sp. NPDC004745 TaxID=3364019 RepID=UPI0036B29787